jgi:hypothetical protein
MNYSVFLQRFLDICNKHKLVGYGYFYVKTLKDFDDNQHHVLGKRWITGGECGGSCWGTPLEPRIPELEPEFSALTSILMVFAPQITFLQYQKIIEFIDITDDSEIEYYGNYTNYTCKYIRIEDLYNLLKEWGYV